MKLKLYHCGGEEPVAEYPLGLGYLVSNAGGEIVKSRDELEDCDMIGLSSTAHGLREAVAILGWTGTPVIIGGQGTLWPGLQDYMFDHIIIGEGERVLKQILNGEELPKVLRPEPVEDLDSIRPPVRGRCGDRVPMITSRGCPFNCNFCSSQQFWQGVRYHSAEYVIEEVASIASDYPNSRTLYIQDDLFISNRARLVRLHDLWLKRGFDKRFGIMCMIRANLFRPETAQRLKDMNPVRVRFGAESGSDRMLRVLGKGCTVEDNQRAIDLAHELGITITMSLMHHLPGETKEDRDMTAQFIDRNRGKCKVEGSYEYTSFPGCTNYDGANPLEERMTCRS